MVAEVAAASAAVVVFAAAVSVVVASVEVALVVAEALVAASDSTAAITAVVISATAGADTSARIIDPRLIGVVTTHDPNRTKIRCVGQSGAPDLLLESDKSNFALESDKSNWPAPD